MLKLIFYLLQFFSSMDSTMLNKQSFLRKEILEAGVDPQEFLEFMAAADRNKGSDLELWKMSELRKVVKEFKLKRGERADNNEEDSSYPRISESEEKPEKAVDVTIDINQGKKSEKTTVTVTNKIQEPVQQIPIPKIPVLVDDSVYIDYIQCETIQPSKFKNMNVDIKVTKHEKIEGGPFERAYVIYTIEILTFKSVVSRRYSDFEWLRDVFSTLNPGYPIPPAAKKGKIVRYDDKYLTKRRIVLEKFVNALVNIPEIAADILLENFLLIREQKEFEKFKEQYKKLHTPPLAKMKRLNGYVTVATEKTLSAKREKYEAHLKVTQPQMKKIYKNFKGAATCLEGTAQYLTSAAANCKFIKEKNEAIRTEFELPPINDNSPFLMLENLCRQYSFQLLNQAKTFRRQIYSLAKYESLYQLNMIEAMQHLNSKQQQYNHQKMALLRKKERLYSQGKMDKWGLEIKISVKPSKEEAFSVMLPKETKEMLALRETFGMYNFSIYEECLRHSQNTDKVMANYLREFLDDQFKISSTTTVILEQLLHRITDVEKYHISGVGS